MKKFMKLAVFSSILMLGMNLFFAYGMARDLRSQQQAGQQQNDDQQQAQQPNHCKLHWQRATTIQKTAIVLGTFLGSYVFYRMFPTLARITGSIFNFGMGFLQCNQFFNWAFGS